MVIRRAGECGLFWGRSDTNCRVRTTMATERGRKRKRYFICKSRLSTWI